MALALEQLWLGMSWYYGGYQKLPMGKTLYDDYLKRTGNGLPLGFLNAGHSAIYAYAAAIRKAGNTDTKPVIAALEGLTFDTAKGRVTLRREDHQAICDVNFIRIKASEAEPTMDILDYSRPDIEVAEFVRYDGASVIEPPTPGQPVVYLSKL
jgi:branched-chain amino acid transport system substrate-binding protein